MVRHVLLVETGLAAARLPRRQLRQLGHVVRLVRHREQIVGCVQQWPSEPVFLGSSNLGLDLKLDPRTANLPFVQLDPDLDAPLLRLEPDARLSDPMTPTKVSEAIAQAMAVKSRRLEEGIVADLSLWIPSGSEELEALCQLLPDWLAGLGMMPAQVRQTTLAVREIVANAIEWGHGYQRSRLVRVECKADHEKVTILVRDTGPGFNRLNLPHAARPGDPLTHVEVRATRQLREGGFGLLMASGLVDHLCFSETGNESLLVKFLPRRAFAVAETFSAVAQ